VDESTLIPTIDTVDDGVSLQVRPIASADLRYVFLELVPEVAIADITNTASFTTFVGQPGGGDGSAAGEAVTNFFVLPQLTEQVLETTVGVPDRGLLVVGGLTRSTREQHEGGVPILDKIPILKRLFSAEGRRIDRTTLFVLARPQIILLAEEEDRMD
jgi:type II secretory pathway component GspD/PulD (secretin)